MSVRVILVGATGMVGGLALRELLRRADVHAVTVVGRRATGVQDARVHEVLHADFLDYGPIAEHLRDQHAALFCLGAYTGAVSDAELRRLTVDVLVAFARALHEASPRAAFCLLSGQGADPAGRSRIPFARYKGAAERALLATGFPRVHVFRPGYIYPVTPRKEPNVAYRVFRIIYPVLRRVYPNIGIASDDLARAMVHAALDGTGTHQSPVLENRAIRALARESR